MGIGNGFIFIGDLWRLLYFSHVFLGFTPSGTHLISYKCVIDDEYSLLHHYSLHWWKFMLGKLLKHVKAQFISRFSYSIPVLSAGTRRAIVCCCCINKTSVTHMCLSTSRLPMGLSIRQQPKSSVSIYLLKF